VSRRSVKKAQNAQKRDRVFAWLVGRLGTRTPSYRARLQAVKNAAWAWRQAIYFLSLCDRSTQVEAMARLRGHFRTAGQDLQARFGPAVDGLAHVIAGGRFDNTASDEIDTASNQPPPDRPVPARVVGRLNQARV